MLREGIGLEGIGLAGFMALEGGVWREVKFGRFRVACHGDLCIRTQEKKLGDQQCQDGIIQAGRGVG